MAFRSSRTSRPSSAAPAKRPPSSGVHREESSMAGKTDFTDDEWQALENGVIGAGMFVSVSEPDFTHTIGETNALATYLTEQGKTSRSKLVRELANGYVNPFAFNAPSGRI